MLPSEYFRRQCYIALDVDEEPAVDAVNKMGAEYFVVSSDYPHSDGAFPEAMEQFFGLPFDAGNASKILVDQLRAPLQTSTAAEAGAPAKDGSRISASALEPFAFEEDRVALRAGDRDEPCAKDPAVGGGRRCAVRVSRGLSRLRRRGANPAGGRRPSRKARCAGRSTSRWRPPGSIPARSWRQLTPFWVLYALHDALVKPMPGNLMAPSLAESWTVSADQRVYEFKLREGLKFHNGDPFTAEDVKFSFQRAKGASSCTRRSGRSWSSARTACASCCTSRGRTS